ncbi:MAG: L-erythro-3,5-diaminohexanoate dehydrogenase [Gaiellales bacterium]
MPLSLHARYGLHRVVGEAGCFPQPAWRLDPDPRISDAEILIDVERLNLDSASFRQIAEASDGDPERVAQAIQRIVEERGKLHNHVTGSGGMLIGRVREVGSYVRETRRLEPGERVATLVSLTLTPLRIERVGEVDMRHGQVEVLGTAVLFESSPYAVLPDDIPERIALAALDVAGAPSRTAGLVTPGDTVLILGGGGTSGLLCLHEARKHAGPAGCVIVTDVSEGALEEVASTGLADHVVPADATDPLALYEAVMEAGGREADVAINLVNVGGTEMGTILLTRQTGTILFFSMATSFTTAALGAEGLGRATTMIIGNGHMPDTGLTALNVLRENPQIRAIFERRYGGGA